MAKVVALMLVVCAFSATAYIFPRPDPLDRPKFARWLVHEANWTVLTTSSAAHGGAPYPNLLASSDGTNWTDCSGHIYFYYASIDTIFQDLAVNTSVTMGFFEIGEDDKVCQDGHTFDAEDPNCAKLQILGRVKTISNVTAGPIPQQYLFWRHPAMAGWPAQHNWLTATLEIETMDILDIYGGLGHISASEYYASYCH